jgi:glucose-1-phosphate thymidylyltransferase
MSATGFRDLHALWEARARRDEYFGTLVNDYLARGGRAKGIKAGQSYVDVGTLHGYRTAMTLLLSRKDTRHLGSARYRDPRLVAEAAQGAAL